MTIRQSLFFVCLLLLLCCATVFLFYGGPGAYALRSVKELWNLGHILYFALLMILVSKILNNYRVSIGWIWILSILLTLSWGIAIEMIQQGGNRNSELMDIMRDICGTLVALVFIPGSIQVFNRRLHNIIRYVIVCFLLIVLLPLVASVSDELIAATQFPVLSNFDTPFEIDRWEGNSNYEVKQVIPGSSGALMKVELGTQVVYPGIGMKYLEADWSDYRYLNMDIYYPHTTAFRLSIKVFDASHRTVQPTYLYHDRFNRSIQLQNGWNRIRVSLQDIRTSPKNREMDITKIAGLQLFGLRLKQPETIYLDRIYLSD